MSYAQKLLSTGERITKRERQHWLVLLWGARLAIVAIVLALLLLILGQNVGPGTGRDILSLLTAVVFIGGLAVLLWDTLRYMNQEYILTNRRVIQVEGVVNKRATDSSLEKINDAVLTQSMFGRMFGFGDLDVLTAAEAGIERFRMNVDPIGFKRAMLDAKHEYEVDVERSGWAPGPPIRETPSAPPASTMSASTAGERTMTGVAGAPIAATPGGATSGASAPTPAAPAAPRADPDEVTRTLASLADLRDRGAITPEEFEKKKADLLSRL
jgi:hypothetical protein